MKLTEDYCNNIIRVFSEEETMETFIIKGNRKYKRFIISNNSHLKSKYQWLWNDIEDIIKYNLGNIII